jgi:hypothetical protein
MLASVAGGQQSFCEPRGALPSLQMKERVRAYTDSPHSIVYNHFVVITVDYSVNHQCQCFSPTKATSQAKPNQGITSGGVINVVCAV